MSCLKWTKGSFAIFLRHRRIRCVFCNNAFKKIIDDCNLVQGDPWDILKHILRSTDSIEFVQKDQHRCVCTCSAMNSRICISVITSAQSTILAKLISIKLGLLGIYLNTYILGLFYPSYRQLNSFLMWHFRLKLYSGMSHSELELRYVQKRLSYLMYGLVPRQCNAFNQFIWSKPCIAHIRAIQFIDCLSISDIH